MEGARVLIKNDPKDDCVVVIENAGPEDNGIWKFEMMTKESHKFIMNTFEAKVDVKGNSNFILHIICMKIN